MSFKAFSYGPTNNNPPSIRDMSSAVVFGCHLKTLADVLAPFITVLFNRSLSSGSVPSTFKDAYIMPLLKKANMD